MTLRHRVARAYLVCVFVYGAPLVNAQPAPCDKTEGKEVAACVETAYPDKLTAGVGLETRKAHLAFLRDRLIETARCAKIDAGLNCKRGNCNKLSLDFIAVREDGITFGVDFAGHSDDVTRTLDLGWFQHGPPTYGHPTYKAYGPVSCIIPPPPIPPPLPGPDWEALKAQINALSDAINILRTEFADLRAQTEQVQHALGDLEVIKTIPSRVHALEINPPPNYKCSRVLWGVCAGAIVPDVKP